MQCKSIYLFFSFGILPALLTCCTAEPEPPAPSITPPVLTSGPPVNVTCSDLAFYLDPDLGDGFECETVPENNSSDIPMDIFIYPAHTELLILNYPLTRTQFLPQVIVYPVDRFSELLPEVVPREVSDLERLLSGGDLNGRALPFLPSLPMSQTFFSHEAVVSFNGGQGIRYITEYNESSLPISNRTVFYTFQGLTDDGTFWVVVNLPISSPILPGNVNFDTLPEGYSLETWSEDHPGYVREVKEALDAQAPGSFDPALDRLDNLVRSITVRP